jgi:glutaconate CoA-transferase subunit A
MDRKLFAASETIDLFANARSIAIGGMALKRRPIALIRELLRRSDLRKFTVTVSSLGLETDLLLGANRVSTIRGARFRLGPLGYPPHFSNALKTGSIRLITETDSTLTFALRARVAGVHFLPLKKRFADTVLADRDDLKVFQNPYTSEEMVAVPAYSPDLSLVHVNKADMSGNAIIYGPRGLDREFVIASKKSIITAERVVPTEEIMEEGPTILAKYIDAVVEMPLGAYPTSCDRAYKMDLHYILQYIEDCRSDRFSSFLELFTRPGEADYLNFCLNRVTAL